ncbi:MAG: hypothetical protein ACK5N8_02170 [Alphaproteobacteria bacterium]
MIEWKKPSQHPESNDNWGLVEIVYVNTKGSYRLSTYSTKSKDFIYGGYDWDCVDKWCYFNEFLNLDSQIIALMKDTEEQKKRIKYLKAEIEFNKKQITRQAGNMEHCLGFFNGKKPKTFFRNYWVGANDDNDELSELGFMEKYETLGKTAYRVLPKGIDFLLGYEFSKKNKKVLLKTETLYEKDFEVQNG